MPNEVQNGATLYVERDINRERWLWAARWPRHQKRWTPETPRNCMNAPHGMKHRSGHAATHPDALRMAREAAALGEPDNT